MTETSPPAPKALWILILLSAALVALETTLSVIAGLRRDPCEGVVTRLDGLELSARQSELLIGAAAADPTVETPELVTPLDTLGREARVLAGDAAQLSECGERHRVRESAVALALLYSEPLPPPEVGPRHLTDTDVLTASLPTPPERSALGRVVADLIAGVPPRREDIDGVASAPASDWVRRRVASYLRSPADAFELSSGFALEERRWGGHLALVVGVTGLFGLAGAGIIAAWPLLRRRLGPPRFDPTGLAEQPRWVTAYAVSLWIALSYTVSFMVGAIGGVPPALGQALVQLTAGVTTVFVLRRLSRRPLDVGLEPFGGHMRPALGFALLGWAVALPIAMVFAHLSALLVPLEDPVVPSVVEAFTSSHPALAALLVISIVGLAPFFEELVFRGVLYRDLRTRHGAPAATVISALLFAAMHSNPATFLPLFGLGLVLAWTVERSGGTLPAMGVHMLWNGGQVLLMLLVRS